MLAHDRKCDGILRGVLIGNAGTYCTRGHFRIKMTSASGPYGTVGLRENHFPQSRVKCKNNGKGFAIFRLIKPMGWGVQTVCKGKRTLFKLPGNRLVEGGLSGHFEFSAFVVDEPETRCTQNQNENDGRDRHIQAEAIDAQAVGADEFEQFVVDFDFAGLEHGRRDAVN